MALKTIPELVCSRLPWLSPVNDLDAITTVLDMQFVLLQAYTKKTDDELDNPSSYTRLEQILFAELTAYYMLLQRVAGTGGGVDGQAPVVNKTLTKTKADVVEAEFTIVKASDGGQLMIKTETLLGEIKSAACSIARELKYRIPLCRAIPTEGTAFIPFITVRDKPSPTWPTF